MGPLRSPAHLLYLIGMVTVYAFATLYPFKWLKNSAVLNQGVATFLESGVLQSHEPPDWVIDAIQDNELSVSLIIQPYTSDQTGPARILSISKDHYNRNLTVGHEGHDLVVRLRRSAESPNGLPPYVLSDVFVEAGIRNIVISIRQDSLRVWIDNVMMIDEALPTFALASWDSGFFLALGNELTWERSWLGEITHAQIETPAGAIDLLSPLMIEAPWIPIPENLSFNFVSTDLMDLLANFFVFVPIGMLTARCLLRASWVQIAAIWIPVCLIMEILQLLVEGRISTLSDVFLNVLGAQFGARAYLNRLRKNFDQR
jgi:hypothetical protein